jgi:hypothetical protein
MTLLDVRHYLPNETGSHARDLWIFIFYLLASCSVYSFTDSVSTVKCSTFNCCGMSQPDNWLTLF